MAGGIFNKQDKVRPGVYQNIYSTRNQNIDNRINGIVAIALDLDFGKEEAITKINSEKDIYNKLGYNLEDKSILLLREIMKKTSKILVYRLNSGEKAKATIGDNVSIEAKYGGTKGNDISVVIANNVEDNKKYDVFTYLGTNKVDEQTVSTYEELQENDYIKIVGTGDIEEATTLKLVGGTTTSQADDVAAYSKFLEALELENYNYIAYTGINEEIKALIVAFVKRMNDEEGIRSKAVMGEYAADYEKITTIKNGVILEDGTELTNAQCAAYYAALSATADINESNTYSQYEGAVDVSPRLNNSDTIKALKSGNIVFTRRNDDTVIVEQDINSLVTYTADKNVDFTKNRFIRTIDGLASNIKNIFEESFIGKLNNNTDGRNILRAEVINQAKQLEAVGAIKNFTEDDVQVSDGNSIDSVTVSVLIQPVDAIEKIYMNVEVQ